MDKEKKIVFVAMSGGVDSSTTAFLLKKQGYNVVGGFIRGFNIDECQSRDMIDARRVAEQLKIPFHVFDFEEEYKRYVVDYMVDGYRKGITPNPDILCNREIKFGLFFKKAIEMGADFVATGHYVKLKATSDKRQGEKYSLFIAKDKNKDQSYFLWTLTQEHLKKCLFPIGEYIKPEIRKIAKAAGLATAGKKDSQGICFLGKVFSIKNFLMDYLPVKKGNIKTVDGKQVGVHDGVWFYTIGQRHGLNLGPRNKGQATRPYYVAGKNLEKNTLIVAEGDNDAALCKSKIELEDINFVNYELGAMNYGEDFELAVLARVRYRQPLVPALFKIQNSKFIIQFDRPVKFIAPGQSAVFYKPRGIWPFRKMEMLGGGVIR